MAHIYAQDSYYTDVVAAIIVFGRIQSMILPPSMLPASEKLSRMNLPKRLELLLYTVLAFPKASRIGLQGMSIIGQAIVK